MELNAAAVDTITTLISGGVALATEDMLWAEMKRRRDERNRKKRVEINKNYYQQRKAAKKSEKEGVAPTPASRV